MKMPTFACVLKLGGDYKPEHVVALASQVRKNSTIDYQFICYTDCIEYMPRVRSLSLENKWPGWWSVPEVFRNIGPTVVVGVDTIITGNITDLFRLVIDCGKDDFFMIRSFRQPYRAISGIMVWNGDWSWLYKEFDYEKISKQLRGEEDYTVAKLKERGIQPKLIQDHFQGVYSWKRNCQKGIPDDCKVLVFHGHPRPFEVPELWDKYKEEY